MTHNVSFYMRRFPWECQSREVTPVVAAPEGHPGRENPGAALEPVWLHTMYSGCAACILAALRIP